MLTRLFLLLLGYQAMTIEICVCVCVFSVLKGMFFFAEDKASVEAIPAKVNRHVVLHERGGFVTDLLQH